MSDKVDFSTYSLPEKLCMLKPARVIKTTKLRPQMRPQNKRERTAKKIPTDPYGRWFISCKECYYWNPDEEQCDYPDAPPCQDIDEAALMLQGHALWLEYMGAMSDSTLDITIQPEPPRKCPFCHYQREGCKGTETGEPCGRYREFDK